VERFWVGDRVWSNNQGYGGRQGTFAEYLAIDERFLYPLPVEADEKQAVAVAHSATTASIGLLRDAKLRFGESILMNGGAANVGSAVLQLATNLGARVIVTVGNDSDLEYCRQLGAEQAVNDRTGDLVTAVSEFAPNGVDVYWDTTTKPDFERAVPLLSKRARIVLMAGLDAHPPSPVGALLHGFAVTNATDEELQNCAVAINEWLAKGKLQKCGRPI
jgi:NADPH2:quinone reductase